MRTRISVAQECRKTLSNRKKECVLRHDISSTQPAAFGKRATWPIPNVGSYLNCQTESCIREAAMQLLTDFCAKSSFHS